MEVKGYRVQKLSYDCSLYEVDGILDFVEALNADEIMVIETVENEEEVRVHFFVREDGEQLTLGLSETDEDNGEKNNG